MTPDASVPAAPAPPPVPAAPAPPPVPEDETPATPVAAAVTGAPAMPAVAATPTPPLDAAPTRVPATPAVAVPPTLVCDGRHLESHLARPPGSVARGGVRSGLVIAHGMPEGDGAAANAPITFPELADRVARDTGWLALTFSFRGAGRSAGGFSPGGWLRDLHAAVDLIRPEVDSVFIVGFDLGGVLALRVAALDPTIGGVAVMAAPSDLHPGTADVAELAALAAASGYLPAGPPDDLDRWSEDLRALDPVGAAAAIPPRPFLIVHGSSDPEVPLVDSRALSEAAEGAAELRLVPMAGHRLRHDPRSVALLLGWLQRHG